MSTAATSYDQIPYDSFPYPQSHPSRLATIATLFGMSPAPMERCRVLELGSAAGGNLVPMAARIPGSEFVGVDLSSRQIEQGQKVVQALGLTNCELVCQDIATVGDEFGQFDYIICHGVWSWVPEHVRSRILAICKSLLTNQGVAFISYNTYPGWHFRGIVRDLMAYRTQGLDNPLERIAEARGLLDFLARTVPEEKNAYGMLLRKEAESLRTRSDSYLAHEHLEDNNHPVYFHQFEAQAASAELQYLGEAELNVMTTTAFGPEAGQVLGRIARTVVEYEQYMDFLRNRTFRQTLLCHQGVAINRKVDPDRIAPLRVASSALPLEAFSVHDSKEARFQSPRGTLSTPSPLFKAAMKTLTESWPQSISFAALAEDVSTQLHGDSALDASQILSETRALGANLIDCFSRGFVELDAGDMGCVAAIEPRPVADALARLQAAHGPMAFSMLHAAIKLTEWQRQVLVLCDGQKTPAEIAAALAEKVESGTIKIQQGGDQPSDMESLRPQLEDAVESALALFVRQGLMAAGRP